MAVHVLLVLQVAGTDKGLDLVILGNVDQVLYGPSLGGTAALGDFVDPEPVALPVLGKEEHVLVVGAHKKVLQEILGPGGRGLLAHAPALLRLVLGQGGALDIARMGDGDHHLLIRDHVLDAEVAAHVVDFGAAGIPVFFLYLQQLLFDDLHPPVFPRQDILEVLNVPEHLVVFGAKLVLFQPGELAQAHLHDGACLYLREGEALDQVGARLIGIGGGADNGDHLVDIVRGDDQPLQDVGPFLGLLQLELGPSDDHLVAVVHKMRDQVLEVQQLRPTFHQRDVVDAEGRLQGRVFVQGVQHDVRDRIPLQHIDDAHPLPVGFVPDIGDPLHLLFVDQVDGLLDHVGLVHLVGDLGDHDAFLALYFLEVRTGADHHPAPSAVEGLAYAFISVDDTPGREVRGLYVLDQLIDPDLPVVDIGNRAVHHFREVVGRHVGGHPDGYAGGPVDQQVRDARGQDGRFLQGVVKIQLVVHGLLLDVREHLIGDLAHARLSIPHRRGAVAIDGAKVPLSVDQHVAQAPVLGHANHGIVYGCIPVRVVLSEHLPHDTGRFLMGTGGTNSQLMHAEKPPPVDRL